MGSEQECGWFIQGCLQEKHAAIYHLWGKRNARIFKAARGDGAIALGDIRACSSTWVDVTKSVDWLWIEEKWNVDVFIHFSARLGYYA